MCKHKFKLKQATNLFNALTRKERSIFYCADRITKSLVKKVKKSNYKVKPKVKLFLLFIKNWMKKTTRKKYT